MELRRLGLVLLVLAIIGCGGKAGEQGVPQPQPLVETRWEPDAKLLESLAPAANAGAFQVRPPVGYNALPANANLPPGVKAFVWAGPKRADQTAPQLMLLVMTPPAEEVKELSLEQFAIRMLDGVKRNRDGWAITPFERGQVNGITFTRTMWSGTDKTSKKMMRGVLYIAKDGAQYLQASSQDVEPHAEAALKLAEAAILTLKKR